MEEIVSAVDYGLALLLILSKVNGSKANMEQMIPSIKSMATFLLAIKNFQWKCYFTLIYKINLHQDALCF